MARIQAIDALRGTVMIIMALDHVRDFFNISAASFSPEDLSRTTPALFLTRWITHFCAPVFVFTAGMGAYFWFQQQERTKAQLSTFLWTRGVWLILLELTAMRLVLNFNFSPSFPILLTILWALGISMVINAALIHLPLRVLAGFSIAVIALHNCLDGIKLPVLHQPGLFHLAGFTFLFGYPVVPWFAVMSAGFCFAAIYGRGFTLKIGIVLTIAFLLIRALNVYGDPMPWSTRNFPILSFLRCAKYPPSLDFLLMTLGPALVYLAWLGTRKFSPANPLIVFGRVPLFFFLVHFYLIRALALAAGWLRFGDISFMLRPMPFPHGFGLSLPGTYCVWILLVVGLYRPCRWFAGVKARRHEWWLSYL